MNSLKDHLVNSLNGGQAFVPVIKVLDGIDKENRNKKTNGNLHTIWEELEHIKIAQHDILQYMVNPDWKSPKWPEGYWPSSVTCNEDQWNESHKIFINDLNSLIELIKNPEIDLLSVIPHTKSHTYLREILIVIEHNAYHIGKILDIRKSLGNW